jgi:hypothetical protein
MGEKKQSGIPVKRKLYPPAKREQHLPARREDMPPAKRGEHQLEQKKPQPPSSGKPGLKAPPVKGKGRPFRQGNGGGKEG